MGRHNDPNYVDPMKMGPPTKYPPFYTNREKDEFEKHAEDAARERKQRKAGQEWLDAYDGKAPSPAPEDPRGPEVEREAARRAVQAEMLKRWAENAKIGQTKYVGMPGKRAK